MTMVPGNDTRTRHRTLDVMRGIAIMGILAMNIAGFALPEVDYSTPVGPLSDGAADRFSWLVAYLVFDGKMMGLFTMLFGASAMLVMDRAEARGGAGGQVHYARVGWLLLFGLVHMTLIWDGDILFYYALCGLFLPFAWHAPPYKSFIAGLVLTLVSYLFSLYLAGEVLDAAGGAGLAEGFVYVPSVYEADVDLYRSGYATIAAHRLNELGMHVLNAFELVPRLLGAMLVGAALFRSGFLIGGWSRRGYWTVAALTLGIGLAVQGMFAFWAFASGFAPEAMFCVSYALPAPFQLAIAVGYTALIVLAVGEGRAIRAIANVGRMSFSVYIGTSLMMTTIFYGYGMGLYGTVERMALWPFVIGGWAAMLLLSNLWLARFAQGPLEYLWRRLLGRGRIGSDG